MSARFLRWSLGVLGTLIVALLVIGIALGTGPDDPVGPDRSPSEQAQLDAEARYRSLASAARAVVTTDPALATRLGDLAADLEAQADAVALPRVPDAPGSGDHVPPSGQPRSSSATNDPSATDDLSPMNDPAATGHPGGSSPTASPPSAPDVLQLLRSSTLTSLLAAVDADPGPGGVLASAAANQWRHTTLLAGALGVDPPLPPTGAFPVAELSTGTGLFAGLSPLTQITAGPEPGHTTSDPADADASGAPGAECTDTPRGSDADRRALLTVWLVEEEARYAYEVAAARLPGRGGMLERSAVHARAAEDAAGRLATLCVEVEPVQPGFALGSDLLADPSAALPRLEQQHVDLYAAAVPLVSRDLRGWAIAALTAAVQRSTAAGAPLDTFPGLPAPEAVPPSSTSTDTSPDISPDGMPENTRPDGGTNDD